MSVADTNVANEVKWRKLNDAEKASYGPHSMVVGFAECCPYCHAKNLRVVSDTADPNSPFVYLENHGPHHEDEKAGYLLCPASEALMTGLADWMCGDEEETNVGLHKAEMSYVEFVAKRFPDAPLS